MYAAQLQTGKYMKLPKSESNSTSGDSSTPYTAGAGGKIHRTVETKMDCSRQYSLKALLFMNLPYRRYFSIYFKCYSYFKAGRTVQRIVALLQLSALNLVPYNGMIANRYYYIHMFYIDFIMV